MFSNFFSPKIVLFIRWKNTAETGGPQMTICRMRVALWIPKARNTPSRHVIFIDFPLQQWMKKTRFTVTST